MALSYYEYTADGNTISFPSKLYLKEEHIVVTLDGDSTTFISLHSLRHNNNF